MKKLLNKWWFRILLIAFVFLIHALVYWITPLFIPKNKIEMPRWMITKLDDCPVLPWTMIFYFGCFIWWIITFLFAKRKRVNTIFFVALFGYIIMAITFIIFPVTIPWSDDQIVGNGLFANLMRFLRTIDVPEKIFPSIHVFVSALSYLAIAFDKEQRLWFRISGLVWLLLVWFSTLALKQHYFVDGLTAIVLALVLYLIIGKTKMPNLIYKLEARWTKKDLNDLLSDK